MNPQEIVEKAQSAVSDGNLAEARRLLIEQGYVLRLEPHIQLAFKVLIPPSEGLRHEQQTTFTQLFASVPETRIKAAKYINRQAHRSFHKEVNAWASDPRSVDTLLEALSDSEAKVVADIANALGMVAWRYLKDLRIYPALKPLLRHPDRDVRYYALHAIAESRYPFDEHWSDFIFLLQTEKGFRFREMIALAVVWDEENFSSEQRARLEAPLLAAIQQKNPADTRGTLIRAIGYVGGIAAVKLLENLKGQEVIADFKKYIDEAIVKCRKRADTQLI